MENKSVKVAIFEDGKIVEIKEFYAFNPLTGKSIRTGRYSHSGQQKQSRLERNFVKQNARYFTYKKYDSSFKKQYEQEQAENEKQKFIEEDIEILGVRSVHHPKHKEYLDEQKSLEKLNKKIAKRHVAKDNPGSDDEVWIVIGAFLFLAVIMAVIVFLSKADSSADEAILEHINTQKEYVIVKKAGSSYVAYTNSHTDVYDIFGMLISNTDLFEDSSDAVILCED